MMAFRYKDVGGINLHKNYFFNSVQLDVTSNDIALRMLHAKRQGFQCGWFHFKITANCVLVLINVMPNFEYEGYTQNMVKFCP